MNRHPHNKRIRKSLAKVAALIKSEQAMARTIHEKVAFILSQADMVGDYFGYQDILDILKERQPDEDKFREKLKEIHSGIVLKGKIFGVPCIEDFDEWLNQYDVKH